MRSNGFYYKGKQKILVKTKLKLCLFSSLRTLKLLPQATGSLGFFPELSKTA